MKINRAIGLIIFLIAASYILKDIFAAASQTTVSVLETVEEASLAATSHIEKIK